ncbi:MAG: ribosome maturation factor RimP [Oscillospiraceae bacterium]
MSKITDTVWTLAEPVAKAEGCEVWDVEYVKEAGGWYLRVYIDREAGVSIDQCEKVSRALDPILDEKDPIPGSYTFEVSSAGAERALRRPSDFTRFMGAYIEVKLYKAKYDRKEHLGYLFSYDDGAVEIKTKSAGELLRFEKNEVANVRLRIE